MEPVVHSLFPDNLRLGLDVPLKIEKINSSSVINYCLLLIGLARCSGASNRFVNTFIMLLPIALLSLVLATIYVSLSWIKKKYCFWKDRGVLTPPISFGWGHYHESILQKKCHGEVLHEFYAYFKSNGVPHGGIYSFTTPIYMPVDINIVKSILQNDFDHFVDRGFYINQEDDPLSANLFTLEEQKWRQLRPQFTPAFSSTKLRMMYGALLKCTEDFEKVLEEFDGKSLEMKGLIGRFTLNVIGSCAFGVECNCFEEPNNDFLINAGTFFHRTAFENFKLYLTELAPRLMRILHVCVCRPSTIEFFRQLTKTTMDYREENNIIRKDFMHLLIQLKNSGKLGDTDEVGNMEKISHENQIHFDDLVGQAFVFFLAGYETPSNAIVFSLHLLSLHMDIQEKARKEIIDVLARHGGKLSYEAISEMHYNESIIKESMRYYPPAHVLNRKCTKDYRIPNTDLVLKKGQNIVISVLGIQRDEEHYPNPEKFDPDRFSNENSNGRNPATFLPFGFGPRNCIGLRLGMMQLKIAVITVIRHYIVSPNPKTKYPLELDTGNPLTLSIKGGLWLNLKKIQK